LERRGRVADGVGDGDGGVDGLAADDIILKSYVRYPEFRAWAMVGPGSSLEIVTTESNGLGDADTGTLAHWHTGTLAHWPAA
jgi:hypothetical protein